MTKLVHPKAFALFPFLISLFGSFNSPYSDIRIGTLTWTAENVDLGHFNNGDKIPEAKTASEWDQAGKEQKPAWCYFEFLGSQSRRYGRFYNWYAVNDRRGLAPKGYHVPTKEEFLNLIETIGRQEKGYKLKSKDGWKDLGGAPANGTNDFGFNALPSGIRANELGKMQFIESQITAYWWSLTRGDSRKAVCLRIDWLAVFVNQEDPSVGMPVRLVKDY